MKIVFVTNEYDAQVSIPKHVALQERQYPDAEVHIVPFEHARLFLPITTTPCVWLLFDELTGDFPLENIDRIKAAVQREFSETEQSSE